MEQQLVRLVSRKVKFLLWVDDLLYRQREVAAFWFFTFVRGHKGPFPANYPVVGNPHPMISPRRQS